MKTECSNISESSGRLEMGLQLSRLSGFRPCFLRMGVVAVSLIDNGTEPVRREVFMMLVMS